MKKVIVTVLAITGIIAMTTGCGHEHTFADATCTAPKTCTECGETEGEPLEHQWAEATCESPKTCKVCGETEGEPATHKWVDATCQEPKHCEVCGATEGELAEHSWIDATCTEAKHCEICGETEGEPAEHSWIDATTEAPKTCEVCGTTEGEPIQPNRNYTLSDVPDGAKVRNGDTISNTINYSLEYVYNIGSTVAGTSNSNGAISLKVGSNVACQNGFTQSDIDAVKSWTVTTTTRYAVGYFSLNLVAN